MKFEKTYCSQCGREFGPGDHGYSDCRSHGDRREERDAAVERWIEAQMITPVSALMQFGNQQDRDGIEALLARVFAMSQLNGRPTSPHLIQVDTRKMLAAIKACVERHAWTMPDEIWREEQKMRELPAYRVLVDAAERARAVNETETLE
jgi:hypothetical protein